MRRATSGSLHAPWEHVPRLNRQRAQQTCPAETNRGVAFSFLFAWAATTNCMVGGFNSSKTICGFNHPKCQDLWHRSIDPKIFGHDSCHEQTCTSGHWSRETPKKQNKLKVLVNKKENISGPFKYISGPFKCFRQWEQWDMTRYKKKQQVFLLGPRSTRRYSRSRSTKSVSATAQPPQDSGMRISPISSAEARKKVELSKRFHVT